MAISLQLIGADEAGISLPNTFKTYYIATGIEDQITDHRIYIVMYESLKK